MTTEKTGAYRILPDSKLIVEYYSGVISASDLKQFKEVISKEPDHDFYFNTIIDFRDADLAIRTRELEGMLEFFRKKFKSNGVRNVAYLTASPHDVVLTKLFSLLANKFSDLKFNLQTFSTTEAASVWLEATAATSDEINSIIDDLKAETANVFQ